MRVFQTREVREDMKEFKRRLMRADCPPGLEEHITYILRGGGKYIRPMLLLSFCRLVGYKKQNSINAALAMEYVHAASLIHDDIIDEASLRRGSMSAHKKWGVKEALLAGDFLYARAFELIGSLETEETTSVLAAAVARLSAGELRDLVASAGDGDLWDKEGYYQTIYDKTAIIFGACCEIAVILAGKANEREHAKSFGDQFGMAFQLRDDMHDYIADSNDGGEALQDLAQGKVTLPLIRAYEIADDKQKKDIRNILKEGGERRGGGEMSPSQRNLLINLICSRPVIEYMREQMQGYLENAESHLRRFADSEVRSSLLGLTSALSNSFEDSLFGSPPAH